MTPGSQQPHQLNICGEPAVIEDCPYCDGSGKRVRPRYIPGSSPHPAASEQEIRADERREVLDEIIKLSTMLDKDETEKWESFGRPKNDGYINGSHSGYLHATRDIRSWIERIKWAERRQQSGGGK